MKIIFKLFGYQKTVYYIEQMPKDLIQKDFEEWCKEVVASYGEWEYGI